MTSQERGYLTNIFLWGQYTLLVIRENWLQQQDIRHWPLDIQWGACIELKKIIVPWNSLKKIIEPWKSVKKIIEL